MRRCYIHIGHAKTATSYLQCCLHLNTEVFAAHGYFVPGEFQAFGFQAMRELAEQQGVMCGNLAPMHVLMCEGPHDRMEPMFDYLMSAPEGSDVVLSSELFFYYVNATARVANAARRRGLAPEILAYLPRQDRASVSAYLQSVRHHQTSPGVVEFLVHDDFIPYLQYYRTLSRLRAKLPDIPFRLRSFAPQFLTDGDIVSDFLGQIGGRMDAGALRRPTRAANQGLLLEQYEALRAAKILGLEAAAEAVRLLQPDLTAGDRARVQAYYYRPYVRRYLMEHLLPGNEALLAHFMPAAGATEREYWQTLETPTDAPEVDRQQVRNLLRLGD